MHIIKLNAIASTNTYLKTIASKNMLKDYTVVVANSQYSGKGQHGTVWQSQEGKNLTISVFKRFTALKVERQFYVSIAVTLGIYSALKKFHIPRLSIKWPNDILSADKKLCGILIEPIIRQKKLYSSVIGIGLNVNQKFFNNLPKASSLSAITGTIYNTDEVLHAIIDNIKFYFDQLDREDYGGLKTQFETILFRRNKPSTFINNDDGKYFPGIITGITNTGKLKVLQEDEVTKTYDIKEISLLY